jgi:hypothetical protein
MRRDAIAEARQYKSVCHISHITRKRDTKDNTDLHGGEGQGVLPIYKIIS